MPNWPRLQYNRLTAQIDKLDALIEVLSNPSGADMVELPLVGGGVVSVNPELVLTANPLTATTTEVYLLFEKQALDVDLSYDDVILRISGM